MEKIRVFLRLGRKPHSSFNEMKDYPPKGVKYIFPEKINSQKKIIFHNIKTFFWRIYLKILPTASPIRVDKKNIDLIHSTMHIMILNRIPWVVEVSQFDQLTAFNIKNRQSKLYMFILEKILGSKYCKRIISWSEASKKSFEPHISDKKILDKIEVVYPSHHVPEIKKSKRNKKKISLLFVSKLFYEKGGLELLEVFKKISGKYDLELTMISNIPPEIKKKYNEIPNLKLLPANFTQKELAKFYMDADIFVHPTFIDIFGYVLIEAQAYGLPIISTRLFCIPEIVEDGRSGFLIDPPIRWYSEDFSSLWDSNEKYLKEILKSDKKNLLEN